MTRRIVARRVCPAWRADARCYRGQCIVCNQYEMTPIGRVEAEAVAGGYGRDFIAGMINDFLHAQVEWEV